MRPLGLFMMLLFIIFSGCEDMPVSSFYTGTLTGVVRDEQDNSPVADVLITTSPGSTSVLTDGDGSFTLEKIEEGTYTLFGVKDGYSRGSLSISIAMDTTSTVTLFISDENDLVGTINGHIYDSDGIALENVNIYTNPGVSSVVSDPSGAYSLSSVPKGDYSLTARKPGYVDVVIPVTVREGVITTADIILGVDNSANYAPSDLTYLTPSQNETGVSTSSDLTWSCDDPDGDTLSYDVYLWKDGNSLTMAAQNLSTPSFSPSLDAGTIYYWMIVAKDGKGGIKSGVVWSFTTT